MKKIIPTLLASAAMSAALIAGTAGSAHAASGVACTLWKSVSGKNSYSVLTIRSCIQWDGTSSDRAYIEVQNISTKTQYVGLGVTLSDDDYNTIASKSVYRAEIAPTQTSKLYTNWVDDYTWGAERAIGTVIVAANSSNTGWAVEPWF
ncbi:hypothetical protein [Streptomyces sp. NPDC056069]|uniref:hypothetical protein n=1 Tax=Streptomyces sp. NPDC056069 TaxID=3345702 RepID=UPI0035DFD4C0